MGKMVFILRWDQGFFWDQEQATEHAGRTPQTATVLQKMDKEWVFDQWTVPGSKHQRFMASDRFVSSQQP